jgi:hypothetical protein
MFIRPSPENDFFPSTLEHRPLHIPEKVALKQYFETSGADEYEGFTPTAFATTSELADFEAWVWGLRLFGRECTVRGSVAAVRILGVAWDAALETSQDDPVPLAAAHNEVLSPSEAVSTALYWANIPSEEKAVQIMEREKPLPEEWLKEPMLTHLQQKPFIWAAIGAWRLIQGILIKRDPAAMGIAQACSAAVHVRMMSGLTPPEAIQEVKAKIILELRQWMGHKW